MEDFLVSIGLEIHVALNTDRKAFSPEGVGESSWTSLGFPGTLPTVNMEAIEKTIKLASALNCAVNYENIVFDRKNYFYYDLPRGYQITQHFHPIGTAGHHDLPGGKRIKIKQIHLEEDSAQQIKTGHEIKLLFGRLGRAVAEIVTQPNFESYEEIEGFLKYLRRVCLFLGISDVSYENGGIRIDLNVSVRKNSEDPLSPKSEVKNLNSLMALRKSLEWLLEKSRRSISEGGPGAGGYTYCWVEKLKSCEVMRRKGDSNDYFYIPESNIPRIFLTKDQYRRISYESRIDFRAIRRDLVSRGLREEEAEYLMDNYHLLNAVEGINGKIQNLKVSYNWMVNVVSGMCGHPDDFLAPELEKVIVDCEVAKKISMRMAKDLMKEMVQRRTTYRGALKSLKVTQLITGDEAIRKMVADALEKYRDQIDGLLNNLPKLERLIIGECMRNSNGQADPKKTKECFEEALRNLQTPKED